MNISENNLSRKICAIILIIALTISDFLFVGQSLVSYAIDAIQTNSSNVEFSAYFFNSDGEKVTSSEKVIGEEEFLYVDIAVKNEGYFTGIITLENNNFNLKQDLSNGISKISGNEVYLNQITAGSTATIKLEVEPINNTVVNKDTLNCETKVKLGGEYVNSKNIKRTKKVTINGETNVNLTWVSSKSIKNELNTSILSNDIYTINEEEKRVVQIFVENNITNNSYPVKNSEITLSVPENTESVMVTAKSTDATNSFINFTQEENCQINRENIKITIANQDENNISWDKNAKDVFVVTYIFDKNIDVSKLNFSASSIVETYDDKQLSSEEKNVHIKENTDGIVSYNIILDEEAIYKGKLYTGEERDFKEIVSLNVDLLNVVNNITLNLNSSKYVAGDIEENANIIYKETKISKNEFINLFGEEGYINIKDENGVVVANINKDAEEEEGYFVVKYINNPTKSINIETSNPTAINKLNIENVKTILNSGYTREIINELKGIKESISVKYNEKEDKNIEKSIELKNTTSEASIEVSPKVLNATEKNENVEFRVVLHNNNEKYDLFKNPVVKINLPEQVEKVDVSSDNVSLLYGNGLEIKGAKKYKDEDGKIVLEINMEGIQNSYNEETIEGTTLILNADIELNKLSVNGKENIKLNYTNEFASSYKNNGEQNAKVKIISENRVITTNSINELNIETIGDEENKQVYLNDENKIEEATIDINIINNEVSAISDVKILGRFPTKESDNLGLTLRTAIDLNTTVSNVKVYYSDNENATSNVQESANNWSEEAINSSKSYLIVADHMVIGDRINAKYKVNIPEKLKANLDSEESYSVAYKVDSTGEIKTVNATNIKLSTGTGAEIEGTLKAYVGGEEIKSGDTVYTGEIIKYELILKNTGSEAAKNVNIEAVIPEGASAIKYVKSSEHIDKDDIAGKEEPMVNVEEDTYENTEEDDYIVEGEGESLPGIIDYFKEVKTTNNKLNTTIESMEVNKEKILNFEIRLNDNIANKDITSLVNLSYLANEKNQTIKNKETNKITNKIEKAELEMAMFLVSRPETEDLEVNHDYYYKLKIKNTSEKTLSNTQIKVVTEGGLQFNEAFYEDGDNYIEENEHTFTIKKFKNGETKNIYIEVKTDKNSDKGNINVTVNDIYKSNIVTENIVNKNSHISVDINSPTNGKVVKDGEKIIYNTTIKNDGNVPIDSIVLKQDFSSYLNILKATINGKDMEYYLIFDQENTEDSSNDIYAIGHSYDESLEVGNTIQISIEAEVDPYLAHEKDMNLTSKMNVQAGTMDFETDIVNHVLNAQETRKVQIANDNKNIESKNNSVDVKKESVATENKTESNNDSIKEDENIEKNVETKNNSVDVKNVSVSTKNKSENNNNSTKEDANNEIIENTYSISGTAWLDENEDGKRDSQENKLDGVKVKLLNVKDKSFTESVETKNGFYQISNLKSGKYIALFEFDEEKYILTKYKENGVSNAKNSDVEKGTMKLNGQKYQIYSTDYLEIKEKNLVNIDIGLLENKIFDFSLSKTISKITVSNTAGTVVKDYNNSTLAKAEIKPEYMAGSKISIEYKLKVKNEGELAGYVKQITDYKPQDLNFDASLNKDWYQSGENLYCTSLANTKIEPGETKEITLILTKLMTETNTGLTNNTAEITEVFNSRGALDIDSTPGNKNIKEDDLAQANVIISVTQGGAVRYVSLTFSIIATIVVCAYFTGRKILKDNIKF